MLFATLPHPTPFMLVPVHLKTEESSYLHRSIGCSLSRQWRAGRAGHGWWLLTTPSWCWRCLPPVLGLCEFLTRLVSHLFKPVLWLNFYYCGNCSQTENKFVSISKLTELRRFLTRRQISRARRCRYKLLSEFRYFVLPTVPTDPFCNYSPFIN